MSSGRSRATEHQHAGRIGGLAAGPAASMFWHSREAAVIALLRQVSVGPGDLPADLRRWENLRDDVASQSMARAPRWIDEHDRARRHSALRKDFVARLRTGSQRLGHQPHAGDMIPRSRSELVAWSSPSQGQALIGATGGIGLR